MKIRPTCGKLLLRIPERQEKILGGIVVAPGKLREGAREAIVERLPDGYEGDLSPGDTVLMPPFGGHEIRINGALMVFIKEEDLLVKFE